ncbi:MAG: PsbP-related protein [Methanobacteriaceae archaeon]
MQIQIVVLALLVSVLLTAGCVDNGNNTEPVPEIKTKAFSSEEISFNYPESWAESERLLFLIPNVSNNTEIASFADPSSKDETGDDTTGVVVNKIVLDAGDLFERVDDLVNDFIQSFENNPSFQLLSTNNITINGIESKQVEFIDRDDGDNNPIKSQYSVIVIPTSDNQAIIVTFYANASDFSRERPKFDIIKNSIKIS